MPFNELLTKMALRLDNGRLGCLGEAAPYAEPHARSSMRFSFLEPPMERTKIEEEDSVGQRGEVKPQGDSGTAEHHDAPTGEHRRWTTFRTECRDGVTTSTEVSEEDEDAIDLVTRYAKLEPSQSSVIRFGNAEMTLGTLLALLFIAFMNE
jgi:hypothetical protein